MWLDERGEFCDATALNTGAAGTYLIGDVIDTTIARDIGNGEPELWVVIQVDTTATSGGSATGQFHLVSDAQAAIATDGSATYHSSGPVKAVATLSAGYEYAAFPLPRGDYERFLGILQTTGTAAFTAGKINAFITRDPGKYRAYARGDNS